MQANDPGKISCVLKIDDPDFFDGIKWTESSIGRIFVRCLVRLCCCMCAILNMFTHARTCFCKTNLHTMDMTVTALC